MKNLQNIKVKNMESVNGKPVPNQFIIETNFGTYFQSYDSIIAYVPHSPVDKVIIDEYYWDYSTTTGRYRNMFLNETKKETKKKIENGTYLLKNLNKGEN